MAGRSETGLGNICGIYVLGPAETFADSDHPGYGETSIFARHGEDYAATVWPVVVKAKAEVSAEQLSQHLRDLADAVDRGFFIPIDPDHDTLPGAIHSVPIGLMPRVIR